MTPFPKRGEIWLGQFDPKIGSEQGGTCPALVLQNDIGNQFANTTIVSALTTTLKQMPVHVLMEKIDGVEKPCMLMLEQIHTIDKQRLIKKLGHIRKEKFIEILESLLYSLGFKEL